MLSNKFQRNTPMLSDKLQYGFDVMIVDDLPDKGRDDILYLIKQDCLYVDALEFMTVFKQYLWFHDCYVYVGDTLSEDLEYVDPQPETNDTSSIRLIRAVNKCPNCGAPLTNGHCSYCECY